MYLAGATIASCTTCTDVAAGTGAHNRPEKGRPDRGRAPSRARRKARGRPRVARGRRAAPCMHMAASYALDADARDALAEASN